MMPCAGNGSSAWRTASVTAGDGARLTRPEVAPSNTRLLADSALEEAPVGTRN